MVVENCQSCAVPAIQFLTDVGANPIAAVPVRIKNSGSPVLKNGFWLAAQKRLVEVL